MFCAPYNFTPPDKKRVQRRKEKTETGQRERSLRYVAMATLSGYAHMLNYLLV